jgi:hypothetical protein
MATAEKPRTVRTACRLFQRFKSARVIPSAIVSEVANIFLLSGWNVENKLYAFILFF